MYCVDHLAEANAKVYVVAPLVGAVPAGIRGDLDVRDARPDAVDLVRSLVAEGAKGAVGVVASRVFDFAAAQRLWTGVNAHAVGVHVLRLHGILEA